MLECQKKAMIKYKEKRKSEGNPIKMRLKKIKCPICDKEYLNSNKSHHYNTKYHINQEKIKEFINNLN